MFKKLFFLLCLSFIASKSHSQLGVGYHHSNLPFIGVNYEIEERFSPEIRLGTDQYMSNLSVEAVLNYKFITREDYDFYGGVGYRVNAYEGL